MEEIRAVVLRDDFGAVEYRAGEEMDRAEELQHSIHDRDDRSSTGDGAAGNVSGILSRRNDGVVPNRAGDGEGDPGSLLYIRGDAFGPAASAEREGSARNAPQQSACELLEGCAEAR